MSALLAAAAGCGLGPGAGSTDVTLTVTRSFGQTTVAAHSVRQVPGSETVMRLLERSFRVTTRYSGGFVESIDGASGDGARHDWFYYVNGVQAPVGAASTAVHRGDRIWWDLHDWSVTNTVPAVVGSFPEPFVHGIGGKRLPTAIECATDVAGACARVGEEMRRVGVPVASQLLGTGSGNSSLAIVVGTWHELRPLIAAGLVAKGPAASGVYARFSADGGALELLDAGGHTVRTLSAGAGLIAATRDAVSQPTWLVTGTDPAGVIAAAGALTPARLRDRFALAVRAGGPDQPLPVR